MTDRFIPACKGVEYTIARKLSRAEIIAIKSKTSKTGIHHKPENETFQVQKTKTITEKELISMQRAAGVRG